MILNGKFSWFHKLPATNASISPFDRLFFFKWLQSTPSFDIMRVSIAKRRENEAHSITFTYWPNGVTR